MKAANRVLKCLTFLQGVIQRTNTNIYSDLHFSFFPGRCQVYARTLRVNKKKMFPKIKTAFS
jgi:hypothetical protein